MKFRIKYLAGIALIVIPGLSFAQELKLSMEDAWRMGIANNKGLAAQRVDVEQAAEQTTISRSYLLPELAISGGYSYYFDRQVIFLPGPFAGDNTRPVVDVAVGGKNTFASGITLSQPILAEASRRLVKVSGIQEEIQAERTRDFQHNLLMTISATYLRVNLLQQAIRLNEQSLERNEKSLEDSRGFYAQGKGLKMDTLRNYIQRENLQTSINYLRDQLNTTLLELRQLTGLGEDQVLMLTDSLSAEQAEEITLLSETPGNDAHLGRSDVRLGKLDLELARTRFSQTRALHLPSLNLIGAYQFQAQADDRDFASYRWPKTSYLGLQANVPVFSGRRIHAKVKYASLQKEKAALQLADISDRARIEIKGLKSSLIEVFRRYKMQAQTVDAASLNYKIVSERYANGLSSRLEVADAEIALTTSKLNQIQLLYDLKIAKLKLDNAMGVDLLANVTAQD